MGLGSNLSPSPMTSLGKTQDSIFSMGLGLGFKFEPKPKTIMGKTALLFTVCLSTRASTSKGVFHHRRHDEEGTRGGAVNREELRRRDEEGSHGGVVERGAAAARRRGEPWRRGEERSCGGGLATSRRCCHRWLLVRMCA